jgi:hypothetical protein
MLAACRMRAASIKMNGPFHRQQRAFQPLDLQRPGNMKIAMRFVLWVIPLVCLGGIDLRVAAGADSAQSPKTEQAPSRGFTSQADAADAVRDLQGRPIDPFGAAKAKAVVLIFVCTDCPIANRYAPEIERLYELYRGRGIVFWLVYADPRDDAGKIQKHLREYQYKITAIRDPRHRLVSRCKVTKTPEAALIAQNGKQVYRGRIDDRITGYGKSRNAPTRRDLQEAMDSVLRGSPVRVATTEVVGCFIPDAEQ